MKSVDVRLEYMENEQMKKQTANTDSSTMKRRREKEWLLEKEVALRQKTTTGKGRLEEKTVSAWKIGLQKWRDTSLLHGREVTYEGKHRKSEGLVLGI